MRSEHRNVILSSLPLADAARGSLQEDLPVISVPLVHQSTRDFAGVVEHLVTAHGAAVETHVDDVRLK